MYHKALLTNTSIHHATKVTTQRTRTKEYDVLRIRVDAREDGEDLYPSYTVAIFFDSDVKPKIVRKKQIDKRR